MPPAQYSPSSCRRVKKGVSLAIVIQDVAYLVDRHGAAAATWRIGYGLRHSTQCWIGQQVSQGVAEHSSRMAQSNSPAWGRTKARSHAQRSTCRSKQATSVCTCFSAGMTWLLGHRRIQLQACAGMAAGFKFDDRNGRRRRRKPHSVIMLTSRCCGSAWLKAAHLQPTRQQKELRTGFHYTPQPEACAST